MKIEAEKQLNSIEQLIIENPLIDTNVSISTLIEHYENEIVKEKRIRSKDEREFENRRVKKRCFPMKFDFFFFSSGRNESFGRRIERRIDAKQ